jgi:hypothetical protein
MHPYPISFLHQSTTATMDATIPSARTNWARTALLEASQFRFSETMARDFTRSEGSETLNLQVHVRLLRNSAARSPPRSTSLPPTLAEARRPYSHRFDLFSLPSRQFNGLSICGAVQRLLPCPQRSVACTAHARVIHPPYRNPTASTHMHGVHQHKQRQI